MSLQEYLEKNYLSKNKKKKPKTSKKSKMVEIFDDAVDNQTIDAEDIETLNMIEEAKNNALVIEGEKKRDAEYFKPVQWDTVENDSEVRKRHDSDSDMEVERKAESSGRKRHDSDSDIDVPRNRHDSDSDIDVPRNRHDSDMEVERKRHDSDSDLEIPRKRHDSDSDTEVPRKGRSDEVVGGLITADKLKESLNRKKELENEIFLKADPEKLGKNASTIIRDKTGKIFTKEEIQRQKDEKEKEALEKSKTHTDIHREQIQERHRAEIEAARAMPFSRYKDDETLNEHYKNKVHWEDPTRSWEDSKQVSNANRVNFTIQKSKKTYKGYAPPNRFKILPGHLWDGVDRSNGFEAKYFANLNLKAYQKQQEYKWSSSDM